MNTYTDPPPKSTPPWLFPVSAQELLASRLTPADKARALASYQNLTPTQARSLKWERLWREDLEAAFGEIEAQAGAEYRRDLAILGYAAPVPDLAEYRAAAGLGKTSDFLPALSDNNLRGLSKHAKAAHSLRRLLFEMHELQQELTQYTEGNRRKCLRVRREHDVKIKRREEEGGRRAHVDGVVHCHSIMCPICAKAKAQKNIEILTVIADNWRGQAPAHSLAMCTLTVAHGHMDALALMMKLMQKAWQRLSSGKAWVAFCDRYGVYTQIRATEETHGDNGWHPHLHILFLLRKQLSDAQLHTMETEMFNRWYDLVGSLLGPSFLPLRGVGARVTRAQNATAYIAKAGLAMELSSPGTKQGRGTNRTPTQILRDLTVQRRRREKLNAEDVARWREADEANRGRHKLHISPAAKALVEDGQLEFDIDELETGSDNRRRDEVVLEIAGAQWDRFANTRLLARGLPLALTYAEQDNIAGVVAVIDAMAEAAAEMPRKAFRVATARSLLLTLKITEKSARKMADAENRARGELPLDVWSWQQKIRRLRARERQEYEESAARARVKLERSLTQIAEAQRLEELRHGQVEMEIGGHAYA